MLTYIHVIVAEGRGCGESALLYGDPCSSGIAIIGASKKLDTHFVAEYSVPTTTLPNERSWWEHGGLVVDPIETSIIGALCVPLPLHCWAVHHASCIVSAPRTCCSDLRSLMEHILCPPRDACRYKQRRVRGEAIPHLFLEGEAKAHTSPAVFDFPNGGGQLEH